MTLTPRDKLLVLLLPAMLTVIGYGFWVLKPKQTELAMLQRSLEGARKAAPTPTQTMEKKAKLMQLVPEIRELEASTRKERDRWDHLACQCVDARKRNERREKLTGLLARHNLSLLEDGPTETDKQQKDVKP